MRRLPLFAAPKLPLDLRPSAARPMPRARGRLSISAQLFLVGAHLRPSPFSTSCLITGRTDRTGSGSTWLARAHSLGWPCAPDGWRMISNDTCFYVAAPALCARDRPCLSDKHPIPANLVCKAWQVDVADALGRRHQRETSHSLSINFPKVSSDSSWPRLRPTSRA